MADISATADFDVYKHIVYKDITKLFWDEYPYKVVCFDDIAAPNQANRSFADPVLYNEQMEYYTKRRTFYHSLMRHCPKEGGWRSSNNGNYAHTFSFFFKKRNDALVFVKKNSKHVSKVFRPETSQEITTLAQNQDRVHCKLELRKDLYWCKYRFRVDFKRQFIAHEDHKMIDAVNSVFGDSEDDDRFRLSLSIQRRLYLNDENDLLMVYIKVNDQIAHTYKAILKAEITDEYELGAQTD